MQDQQPSEGEGDAHPPQRDLGLPEDQLPQERRRYKVGGGGGHSGLGGGRGVPESFGQKGPHHSVTGEEQSSAQQPQWDMQPVTRTGLVRVPEAPLLAPCPQSGLTHSLQVVRS